LPVVAACLVRNEADRYWPEVLAHLSAQVDGIVVVDDNSTDATPAITDACPAVIKHIRRLGSPMWGREAPVRKLLWETAAELGDWVLINDADQLLVGDVRGLCRTTQYNAWAVALYDLWGDRQHYRTDGPWQAHLHARPWLFNPHRTPSGWVPSWGSRGVHVGHCPANFPMACGVVGPDTAHWLHLAYVRAEDRAAKLTRYRSVGAQLSEFEKAHAESIADAAPLTQILPSHKPIRVLIGGPVRKRLDVLRAHLDTLAWQELPPRVEVGYCFVPDFEDPADPALAHLEAWVAERKGVLLQGVPATANDFGDTGGPTHRWTQTAMGRVGANKNIILRYALQNNYDYVWLVDSDLVLDPYVLRSLLDSRQPLVAAVYWTRWDKFAGMKAGPQVWLRHIYEPFQTPGIVTRGMNEGEFRAKLVARELTRVWGLGACTLIRRDVVEKGVGFHQFPALPKGGLWDGEDRHFCSWAEHLHVPMAADPWPDIFHVYHDEDVAKIPEYVQRFSEGRGVKPELGELVNVRITPLEEPGSLMELVRCRIGDGTLLPDVESAITDMRRGDTRIVRAQFPAHYPLEQYRNQQKLLEVALCDFKCFGFPPVLEDEMYVTKTGAYADATALTAAQQAAMAEDK
jgi:hypothetical protein